MLSQTRICAEGPFAKSNPKKEGRCVPREHRRERCEAGGEASDGGGLGWTGCPMFVDSTRSKSVAAVLSETPKVWRRSWRSITAALSYLPLIANLTSPRY